MTQCLWLFNSAKITHIIRFAQTFTYLNSSKLKVIFIPNICTLPNSPQCQDAPFETNCSRIICNTKTLGGIAYIFCQCGMALIEWRKEWRQNVRERCMDSRWGSSVPGAVLLFGVHFKHSLIIKTSPRIVFRHYLGYDYMSPCTLVTFNPIQNISDSHLQV